MSESLNTTVLVSGQANGPALYIDGQWVGHGERRWLGYAINFDKVCAVKSTMGTTRA